MFHIVLGNLITLLICMFFGYICYKKKIINDEINSGLSNLLIKVTLPCIVIFSMQKPLSDALVRDSLITLFASAVLFLSGAGLGLLLCRLLKADKAEKGIWVFALTLPNIVYMGFPVIGAALGTDALFYVSVANIAFNTICFSIGLKLITLGFESAETNIKSLLTNPAILATFFGLLLFIFSLELPEPVNNALSMVGNMTTPISMIIIGAMLAKSKFINAFGDKKLIVIILARQIFIPVIAFIVFRSIIDNRMVLGVLVLMAGMPVASVTAILAEKYGGNAQLGSKTVFVSTVTSILTIPLISLML